MLDCPFVFRHPEWWSLALSLAAWGALFVRQLVAASGHHLPMGLVGWAEETVDWLLMVLAMMVPLSVFSIRVTATRSLWQRRDRAMGGFLLGYLSPWAAAGAALSAIDITLNLSRWLQLAPWLGGLGFGVAALWQLAPARQRALRACHRTVPLAPRGWHADRDCLRFGWWTGAHCLTSCWALMLACVLAGHSLTAMLAVSIISVAERYVIRPTNQQTTFSPLVGIALVYAIVGVSALPAV